MNAQPTISIQRSFRTIQGVVCLLLIFLMIQGWFLWRTCTQGVKSTIGLEQEALPSLHLLATLQEGLAIYRLHSYELMFAQEKDRPAKIAQTDAVLKANQETLQKLNQLYPAADGHAQVARLQVAFDDYVKTMAQIRAQIDKDFPAAMQLLDNEIPAKVSRLVAAAVEVEDYCRQVAEARTKLTIQSFDQVRNAVLSLGTASVVFALLAAVLVTFNSSRVRKALNALAETLAEASHSLINSAATISASSETLATGSSEQAASIEETGASLEEMTSMTKRNAENAQQANELAKQTRSAADKGVEDIQIMSGAMQDIQKSSDDIAKIIKTIDEIAFQTNILALNAAVEAARAGEAGLGFAVVADEVRNLAQRSAQAAKETANMIESAIVNTARGVQISGTVSGTLSEIVDKARRLDELAAEVAGASREQSQGITQINSAVGQMDKVTQGNAAAAEEAASAAQELNSQAKNLNIAVSSLAAMVGRGGMSAEITPTDSPKPARAFKPAKIHTNGNHRLNGNHAAASRDEIPMDTMF